ncbi:hypothetical protein KJ781_04415 [Patescibacteria group bacterium]|nr:hypothetical protein [Patescibacteria group bacterium]MBU1449073.1 hypothetical protein [Patescibacteria group bacterium]
MKKILKKAQELHTLIDESYLGEKTNITLDPDYNTPANIKNILEAQRHAQHTINYISKILENA